MKKYFLSACIGLFALGCLSGCAKPDATNLERYTLTQDVNQSVFISKRPVFVSLAPILAQGGVVIEISDISLRPAKNYRYSTNLDNEMRYVAIDMLDKAKFPESYVVKIFVSKFQGSLEGEAKVSVYIEVKNRNNKLLYSKSIERNARVSDDGYGPLVRQMKLNYIAILEEFLMDTKQLKLY